MLDAAPMLITSVQFALQHLLARLAIATPWVAAPEDGLSWEDWWKKGEQMLRQSCWQASLMQRTCHQFPQTPLCPAMPPCTPPARH
jgi:hypothetical protein